MKRALVLPGHAAPIAAALLLLVLGFCAVLAPRARSADQGVKPGDPIPGELVVGFEPSASAKDERKAVTDAGGQIASRIPSIDAAVVNVDPDKADQATATMNDKEAVSYVEPNYAVSAF